MSSLNKANFKCPTPIINNKKSTITDFEGKKLMIVSFLEGKAKQNLSPIDCNSVGKEIAKMHEITKNFEFKRKNDLSVKSWRSLFESVKDKCSNIHKDLPNLLRKTLGMLKKIGQKICQKELFMLIFSMITFFSIKTN